MAILTVAVRKPAALGSKVTMKVVVPPPKTEAEVKEREGHSEYERFDFYLNKKDL